MTQLYHVFQLPLFPSKVCTSCLIEKPLDEFYKQSPSRGGYQAWCKVCWKEHRQQKRLQNIQNFQMREHPISQVCIQCENEKPIDAFYIDTNSESGYRSTCKDCLDCADKRRKNPGKRRSKPVVQEGYKWCYGCKSEQPYSNFLEDKTKHDGYRTKCNDCCRKRARKHWQNNRENYRMYSRNHYERCIEQERTRSKEKSKRPRSRLLFMATMSRREARKRTTIVEEVDFKRIIERDEYHCHICDKSIDSFLRDGPGRLVFDHIIPLARGGTHTEDNIKPAHRVCNERKNVRLLSEMTSHQRRGPDA